MLFFEADVKTQEGFRFDYTAFHTAPHRPRFNGLTSLDSDAASLGFNFNGDGQIVPFLPVCANVWQAALLIEGASDD